jgi:hypothetical protein
MPSLGGLSVGFVLAVLSEPREFSAGQMVIQLKVHVESGHHMKSRLSERPTFVPLRLMTTSC